MVGTRTPGHLRFDATLLVVTLILVGIGMVMVYSASSMVGETRFESSSFFFRRHLLRAMVSIALMLLVLRVDYHLFARLSGGILMVGVVLLIYLAGRRVLLGGIQRWIYLGPISFQPADLVRLGLVLYIARWLAREGDRIRDFRRGLLRPLGLIACTLGLIVVQPALGTTIAIGMILFVLLFVGRMRFLHMFLVGVAALPVLYVLTCHVAFRWRRLTAFWDPSMDAEGTGYQIKQSLLSLGTGGVFGVGLGAGRQKHLFLPEPHTDFVFSIIGEELGFVGALSILILFLVFAWRGLRIAYRTTDAEGFFMAVGLTFMIALYAFFNVAVAMGLMPTTGLPLPFISYGGSSLLLSLVGTGILLNISSQVRAESRRTGGTRSIRRRRSQRADPRVSST